MLTGLKNSVRKEPPPVLDKAFKIPHPNGRLRLPRPQLVRTAASTRRISELILKYLIRLGKFWGTVKIGVWWKNSPWTLVIFRR